MVISSPTSSATVRPQAGPAADDATGNISTLGLVLGLSNNKCGATKPDGQPCNSWTPAKNRLDIGELLQKLVGASQSDRELGVNLEALARKVHCRYHNHGEAVAARWERWIEIFPKELEAALESVIVGCIRKVFGRVPAQCAAWPTELARYKLRVGGANVQTAIAAEQQLRRPEIHLDEVRLAKHLRMLHDCRFCHVHIKTRSLAPVLKATEDISWAVRNALIKAIEDLDNGRQPDDQTEVTTSTITNSRVERGKESRTGGHTRALSPQRSPSPDRGISAIDFMHVKFDISPLRIIERDLSPSFPHQIITSDLNTREREHVTGFVYCFKAKGNDGFVKIGYTSRDIELRQNEWVFDCNRQIESVYPLAGEPGVPVKYAHRVEALCHAELDKFRVKVDCEACLKPHLEWFQVDAEIAIASIRRWTRFANLEPYALSGGKWTLKEEWWRKTEDWRLLMQSLAS